MEIILCINGQQLEAKYPKLYSGSVGVLYAKFAEVDFDSALIKAVRFKTENSDWYTADITDGTVRVPHEVIVPGGFDIALAGYEENGGELTKFLPTNSVHIDVFENGYGEPDAPLKVEVEPESYVAQVERLVTEATNAAEEAKSTAESALTGLENKANTVDVYTKSEADELFGSKVDKESGKGLSAVADIAVLGKAEVVVGNRAASITELPIHQVAITREDGTNNEYEFISSEHRDSFDHPDKSVTNIKIADKAVTMDKLADNVKAEIDKKANAETAEGTIVRTGTSLGETGTVTDVMNIAIAANEQSLNNKAAIEDLQAEKADKSDLETKADAKLLKKLIPKATVIGNPVILTDHAEGVPAVNYRIYGNSVQDGTPSYENPIEIESVGELVTEGGHCGKYKIPIEVRGKNLLNPAGVERNGTGSKYGEFELNGDTAILTTAETCYGLILFKGNLKLNTQYTISMNASFTGTYSANYGLRVKVGQNGEWGPLQHDNLTYTFTTGETDPYIGITYYVGFPYTNAGDVLTVTSIQLEEGAAATEYEPYIAQSYDIYADEPLRKLGSYADYADFEGQRIVRQIVTSDNDGEKTIEESFSILDTSIIEPIDAPFITIPDAGAVYISAGIGNVEVEYYLDINKKLAELRETIV